MAETDHRGSQVPLASIGLSILSFRREQVHAVDGRQQEDELASFQRQVADLFHDLAGGDGDGDGEDLLSVKWIQKLLDLFLICQEEFRMVLFNHNGLLANPPLDRLMADFFDRAVRALDVLNAIRDGIEQVRQWLKHVDIVLAALDPRLPSFGQGQLRRAKKALAELAVLMLDNKDSAGSVSILAQRNRSFGRGGGRGSSRDRRHFRSLTWSVSRSWSAARQLQAIGGNLVVPRGQEIAATHGLANPLYTMSSVLHFVMWSLVAAIPCQDRGLQAHFSIPRSFPWAASVMLLHDRVMEEAKKRDRKHSSGLLKEIHQIEKCVRRLMELTDTNQFQLSEEEEIEARQIVQELAQVHNAMKDSLDPLEHQVREVFHRIVRNRTEGLDSLLRNPE